MEVPVYVPILFEDHVRLEGDTRELRDALAQSSWAEQVFYEKAGGMRFLAIRFSGGDDLDNSEFVDLLLWLNGQGVRFGVDYKQSMDPEGVMMMLQKAGKLDGVFRNIYWAGPEPWHSNDVVA